MRNQGLPAGLARHSVRGPSLGKALLAVAIAALAGGCSLAPEPARPTVATAAQWQAPVAHSGTLSGLAEWWTRFDDPLLAELVRDAERASPTLDAALARIEQARANALAAGARLWPTLDANASLQRAAAGIPPLPAPRTSISTTLDAAWEIDLFGAVRNTRAAAVERIGAREAEWHDARASLAAEVANAYVSHRACEALANVQSLDVQSLGETLKLTELKVKAGFTAPADAALLRATLADARNRLVAQRAECDVLVKTLAYLSAELEPALRTRIAARAGLIPDGPPLAVEAVPAAALAQRPDLAAIEREIAAAAAEVGVAEAARYPRVTLTGSVGRASLRLGGNTLDGNSWGFGPAISLPIFDAGRRSAQAEASRARLAELRAQYVQRARLAVREVEEALTRLDAATRRQADAESAVADFGAYFAAAQSRWNVGVGNLVELEDARRQTLAANANLIGLRRDRIAQWVALYKALGGGWTDAARVSRIRE